ASRLPAQCHKNHAPVNPPRPLALAADPPRLASLRSDRPSAVPLKASPRIRPAASTPPRDAGPISVVALRESLLHDRPDALEEIIAHRRLRPVHVGAMRYDGSRHAGLRIGIPKEILFNGNRHSGFERPVDTVCPSAVVWIAVMRVHRHAGAG